MVTVLVTGTNQGIGFGIVQQLAKRSDVSQIFATVRDPTSSASAEVVELAKTTKNLHVIKMVLKEDAIAVLVIRYL
jgi:NAD(P)-dependent dehydrogenase (short-subunit alcohol dehydrogenase family)